MSRAYIFLLVVAYPAYPHRWQSFKPLCDLIKRFIILNSFLILIAALVALLLELFDRHGFHKGGDNRISLRLSELFPIDCLNCVCELCNFDPFNIYTEWCLVHFILICDTRPPGCKFVGGGWRSLYFRRCNIDNSISVNSLYLMRFFATFDLLKCFMSQTRHLYRRYCSLTIDDQGIFYLRRAS